ncbi:ribonuclease E inhibitor RraB [Luteibacter sp. ME-Dv--P-043b]|uniref:ribonuclease E inhibitor RraB n=1 Tax=Luteibacter sp. ME-Dv--P-043b TaxID=3040291 RepID=UPI00255535EA|nr:ribonuclease E inhibitor RraB [Luteibacter sp. ME-Dv--P-043b]
MNIVKELASIAHADIDLLRLRDQQGDVFARHRPVDFVFVSMEESQASAMAGFLSDYQYATTTLTSAEGEYRVVATISMAVEQHEILSVSGFMQCIAVLFKVSYDGWGAPIVSEA